MSITQPLPFEASSTGDLNVAQLKAGLSQWSDSAEEVCVALQNLMVIVEHYCAIVGCVHDFTLMRGCLRCDWTKR